MSQEKINFVSLADQVAHKARVSRKEAEDFLKLFILVIEEALINQEIVKIKGFGTLKPQWNAPRKSVDVNTGEEITLAGYFKINFIPEASLKEAVNEPFAHFEPVILSKEENKEFPKTTPKVNNITAMEPKEETQVANLDYFSEQASEIKEILSEINAIGKKDEPKSEEVSQIEVVVAPDQPIVVETEVDIAPVMPDFEEPEVKVKRNNHSVVPMLVLGVFIGVALVYILSYLKILPELHMPVYQPEPEQIVAVVPEPEFIPDTVIQNEVVVDESVDSLQVLFGTPREYTEFIASENVISGSRLTRIAERHYGVKLFWVFIYEANKHKIPDPENLPVGILLRIPKLNPVLADTNNERSMNYLLELQKKYLSK